MALKVVVPKAQPALKVVNAGGKGVGTSTYNPQPAAVYKQPTYNPQPAAVYRQPTGNPQNAATAQQLAQVTAAQVAQAALIQRQEQDRIQLAKTVKKKTLQDALNTKSTSWTGKLATGVGLGGYYKQRQKRETAKKFYTDNEKEWASNIERRQRNYEHQGATLKDWVMQAYKDGNEAEYNRRYDEATKWLDNEYKAIGEKGSEISKFTKTQQELAKFGDKPLTGKVAGALALTKGVSSAVFGTPLKVLSWTASQPSRAINTFGNLNTNNRTIYKEGGTTAKIQGKGIKAAYNATKDQRSFNLKPFTDVKPDSKLARSMFDKQVQSLINARKRTGSKLTTDPNQIRKEMVDSYNRQHKLGNTGLDLAADPLNYVDGLGLLGKSNKVSKLSKFTQATPIRKLTDFIGNSKVGKAAKWLNSDFKTPEDKVFDAITHAKNMRENSLADVMPRILELDKKITGGKRDFSVFNDLRSLTDSEAKIIQRMKAGKFATKDAVMLAGKKADRARLQAIANKWEAFAEDMKQADRITSTRFGMGRRTYSPRTSWIKNDKSQYKYWLQKKHTNPQSAQDFSQGAMDRYLASQLRHNPNSNPRHVAEREALIDRHNLTLDTAKADVTEAVRKTKTPFNKARRLAGMPLKLWKKSVLLANPAWYVNNIGTNIPFSVSAAGLGTLGEHAKLLRPSYFNASKKKAIEGVASKISHDVGKGRLARFASRIEDTSRLATYNTLKKKGYSDEKALKITNRWLFDYTTKNYERPFKTALPFLHWQKNLIKLSAGMAITNPRSAKFYSEFQKNAIERPYNNLPDGQVTYTDEQGQQQTFSPKQAYKGKVYLGKDKNGNLRFANLPSYALNPDKLMDFGVNPFLTSAEDLATSSNKYGQSNTNRKAWTVLGERFPQINLGRAGVNRNNIDKQKWFSKSGYSKEKQGTDPTATNYDDNLDNKKKFVKQVKSYTGVPNVVTFDNKQYEKTQRLTKFSNEYFNVDWDKRLQELKDKQGGGYMSFDDPNNPYSVVKREQAALAKKHGFDLQKDIYDGAWSKYDSETTKRAKQLKKEAFDFESKFWRDYLALPAGDKTHASQRRPFLIGKYDEWARNHTFAQNGYRDIPKFTVYKDGAKTDKKAAKNPFDLKREQAVSDNKRASVVKYDGKFFKSAASRDKYIAGKAKHERKLAYERGDWQYFKDHPSSGMKSGFERDGKFFKSKETADKYTRGKLWADYYSLKSVDDKQAFLDKHPELRTFKQPQTQEEWKVVKDKLKLERKNKLQSIDGFLGKQQDYKDMVAKKVFPRSLPKRRVVFKS